MRNIWTLMQREYLERVRTRSFLIFTLLMPAAMAGIVFIPTKIAQMNSGGERQIVIVADDMKLGETVGHQLAVPKPTRASDDEFSQPEVGPPTVYAIQVVNDTSEAERDRLNQQVSAGKITGYLWLSDAALEKHRVVYSTKEAADFDQSSDLRSALRSAVIKLNLEQRGMTGEDVDSMLRPIRLETVRVEKGHQGTSGSAVFLTAFGMVMLLYAVILVYGMNVMRSVIEEKSTRILEVLLSTVTSKELLAGKILGVGAVGLTQILVWIIFAALFSVPGLIAAKSFLGQVHLPMLGMIAFGVFFLLGYLLVQCDVRRHRRDREHRPGGSTDAVACNDADPHRRVPDERRYPASQLGASVLALDRPLLRAHPDAGAHPHRAASGVADRVVRRHHVGHDLRPVDAGCAHLPHRNPDVRQAADPAGTSPLAEVRRLEFRRARSSQR